MSTVKHVLLVANSLSELESTQLKSSLEEMKSHGYEVKVSLLYVKPYFPTCYFHIPSMVNLSQDFEEEAKETLQSLGYSLNVAAENQWIATGRVRPETMKIAASLGVDFILSSGSIHRELNQSSIVKRNRKHCPVKSVDALRAA